MPSISPVPLNTPIDLKPTDEGTLYVEYNADTDQGQATVAFYYRDSPANYWSNDFDCHAGYRLSGKTISKFVVSAGTVVWLPGVSFASEISTLFGRAYGNKPTSLSNPASLDTLMRSLERVDPRQGQTAAGIPPTSIASGGSDLTGDFFTATAGDFGLFMLGISQDSLGTSPHSSYVIVTDPNGDNIIQQYGAIGNGYITALIPLAVSGSYSYTCHNGDSVAHYFQALGTVFHG